MTQAVQEQLRKLPQIEEVLSSAEMQGCSSTLAHATLVEAAREAVNAQRKELLDGRRSEVCKADIFIDAATRALIKARPSLRHVVNATGVVIHTNLGRSSLAQSAIDAVVDVASHYSTLEYDTQAMTRGSRHTHVERLICALTGAEAAMAVNNNAAAVMMVLNEFARGREAVVSRGEEVEIGGAFRIPDIMEMSDAHMVEIGTTNKTHVADYRKAITPETAMLLKVHTSNYRVVGFTESVSIEDIRKVADEENARRAAAAGAAVEDTSAYDELLVYEDLGSGAFLELPLFERYGETTVRRSLERGMDLVSFSGDKLLGGPQAGIIVGKKSRIDRLKKNPLARAMRLDKMTIAALEATLRLYLDSDRALAEIPTLRMLSEDAAAVGARAEQLRVLLEGKLPQGVNVNLVEDTSRVGGGSLPLCELPTVCVALSFDEGQSQTPESCFAYLVRENDPAIVGRIKHDALLLDVRTVFDDELSIVAEGVIQACASEVR